MKYNREYSKKEEILHSLTHFVGAILAIFGTIILLEKTKTSFEFVIIVGYCSSLLLTFLSSGLFHITTGRIKKRFKELDYYSIPILIAATYTTYILLGIQYFEEGWYIVLIVWACANVSILLKFILRDWLWPVYVLYVLTFSLPIILYYDIFLLYLPILSFNLGLLGYLAYIIGFITFLLRHLKYNHVFWHLFVLLASILQYAGIYYLFGYRYYVM